MPLTTCDGRTERLAALFAQLTDSESKRAVKDASSAYNKATHE